jgi:hypothetical protein
LGEPRRLPGRVEVKTQYIALAAFHFDQQRKPVDGHFDVGVDERQPFTAGDRRAAVAQGADVHAGHDQHPRAQFVGDARAMIVGAVVDHDQLALQLGLACGFPRGQ